MKISIFALGSEKFVRACRLALGEVSMEGEPAAGDVVLIEPTGPGTFQEAKDYLPARVFVISPPDLDVWREATEAGVTVLSSVEKVASKLHSYRGLPPAKKNALTIQTTGEPKGAGAIPVQKIPYALQEQTAGLLLNTFQKNKSFALEEKNNNPSSYKRRGRLICIYSLIGGVGKTTISLNLAALLKDYGRDPCLVDFDFNSAGTTVYFWPDPTPTPPETILLWEDFPREGRESRQTVEDFLAKVPFGFHVLPAPKDIMLASLVSDVLPGTVLEVLLEHFDFVIVDLGTDMRQFGAKKALSMADTVLLVARPDDVSVSGAVRFLSHVGAGKLIRPDRLKFVVNRDRPRAPRRPAEVAAKAGIKLDFVLPEDEQSLAEAAKRHMLPVLLKDSLLGDAVTALAEGIIPDLEAQPSQKRWQGIAAFFNKLGGIFKRKGAGRR